MAATCCATSGVNHGFGFGRVCLTPMDCSAALCTALTQCSFIVDKSNVCVRVSSIHCAKYVVSSVRYWSQFSSGADIFHFVVLRDASVNNGSEKLNVIGK